MTEIGNPVPGGSKISGRPQWRSLSLAPAGGRSRALRIRLRFGSWVSVRRSLFDRSSATACLIENVSFVDHRENQLRRAAALLDLWRFRCRSRVAPPGTELDCFKSIIRPNDALVVHAQAAARYRST